MKHIFEFEDFLNEAKQAGVVYHYTTPHGFAAIMSEDRMASGHQHISFSRNPDLKQWYKDYGAYVRIAFNGSDMTNKFHIEPYLFDPSKDPLFGGGSVSDPETRRKYYKQEMEERIPGEEITGVKKYILRVDVIENLVDDEEDREYIETGEKEGHIKVNYVDKFTPVKA